MCSHFPRTARAGKFLFECHCVVVFIDHFLHTRTQTVSCLPLIVNKLFVFIVYAFASQHVAPEAKAKGNEIKNNMKYDLKTTQQHLFGSVAVRGDDFYASQ